MALTLDGTNWPDLTGLSSPGVSANPVLKLTGNGGVLWLKAATGGRRIEFAGKTLGRLGFASGVRVVIRPEANTMLSRMKTVAGADAALLAVIAAMESGFEAGKDLVLMDDVPGQTYGRALEAEANPAAFHLVVLASSSIQDDMARLIAADLLLGNFDRLAYNRGDIATQGWGDSVKAHVGNFIYQAAAQRFLPIDNDTVAPSLRHIRAPRGSVTPTKEDLYKTVILGGALAVETTEAFPAAEQASMDALLGSDAVSAIEKIIGNQLTGEQKAVHQSLITMIAALIAPKIKVMMQLLLDELKKPDGTGLNSLMKSYENIEGMNYGTFKIKSRFAKYLLDSPRTEAGEETAKVLALQYARYREWKEDFDAGFDLEPSQYMNMVPRVEFERLTKAGSMVRLLGRVVKNEDEAVKALKDRMNTMKSSIRTDQATAERQYFQTLLDEIRLKAEDDRTVVKVKVMVIAHLVRLELRQLFTGFDEIAKARFIDPVASLYKKAARKRDPEMRLRMLEYSNLILALTPNLKAMSRKDNTLISQALLTEAHNATHRAWTQLLNM